MHRKRPFPTPACFPLASPSALAQLARVPPPLCLNSTNRQVSESCWERTWGRGLAARLREGQVFAPGDPQELKMLPGENPPSLLRRALQQHRRAMPRARPHWGPPPRRACNSHAHAGWPLGLPGPSALRHTTAGRGLPARPLNQALEAAKAHLGFTVPVLGLQRPFPPPHTHTR